MSRLTQKEKEEISKIFSEFAHILYKKIGSVNGGAEVISSVVSEHLNAIGYHNTLGLIPKESGNQVLVMTFSGGSRLIMDESNFGTKMDEPTDNWTWIDAA